LPSLLAFAGCAAFGVPATSDSAGKLRDATALFDRQDRPLPAERLIREALEVYQRNGDQLGVAEAYRTYGFFFRARSVGGKWSKFYRDNGFLDRSATFDTRYMKSIEYFEMARAIFSAHQRFDALTNVDLNMGFTFELMGNAKLRAKRSIEVGKTIQKCFARTLAQGLNYKDSQRTTSSLPLINSVLVAYRTA